MPAEPPHGPMGRPTPGWMAWNQAKEAREAADAAWRADSQRAARAKGAQMLAESRAARAAREAAAGQAHAAATLESRTAAMSLEDFTSALDVARNFDSERGGIRKQTKVITRQVEAIERHQNDLFAAPGVPAPDAAAALAMQLEE